MSVAREYVDLCNRSGIRVDQINPGSEEFALPRMVAMDALRVLRQSTTVVVGGDVLRMDRGCLQYAYANWSCGRRAGENWADYAERSNRQAEHYIREFQSPEGFDPLFVLVLSDSE